VRRYIFHFMLGLVATWFLLAAAIAAAQSEPQAVPAYRARILGVFDDASGAPVDSARVTDVFTGMSSLTTRTGTVALIFVPDGGGLIRIQKLGYEMQTLVIAISPADTVPVTLTLRRVTQLSTVVTKADSARRYISPQLNAFEARRKLGTGYFVDETVMRANEGRPLANLLASQMPQMRFMPGAASAMFLLKSARCAGGGPPQVFLDGVPMSPDQRRDAPGAKQPQARTAFGLPAGGGPTDNIEFDLSQFNVSNLAAAEWYPDSDMLPIDFSHTSARCGALLLWTREH
jgi:hypothetical protein